MSRRGIKFWIKIDLFKLINKISCFLAKSNPLLNPHILKENKRNRQLGSKL